MANIEVNSNTVGTAMAAAGVGFGATGLLAPSILMKTYGLPDTGPFRFLGRLWGTRTIALAALYLLEDSPERRNQLAWTLAAMNAADAAVAVTAGRDVSTRTKVMAVVTSATFAAAAGAVAAELI